MFLWNGGKAQCKPRTAGSTGNMKRRDFYFPAPGNTVSNSRIGAAHYTKYISHKRLLLHKTLKFSFFLLFSLFSSVLSEIFYLSLSLSLFLFLCFPSSAQLFCVLLGIRNGTISTPIWAPFKININRRCQGESVNNTRGLSTSTDLKREVEPSSCFISLFMYAAWITIHGHCYFGCIHFMKTRKVRLQLPVALALCSLGRFSYTILFSLAGLVPCLSLG